MKSENGRFKRKYNHNENFFKIWSHGMAYILGFWWADGCITGNYFRVDQHKKDKYLLENIVSVMKSNNKILITKNMARLSICSREIVKDIKLLEGTERKSLTCKMPLVPLEYLPDFVRGDFDGDGCIWYNKIDCCFESLFCSGSKSFMYEMFSSLKNNIPNLHGRVEERSNNGGRYGSTLFIIKFGRNDTIRLRDFMYANNPNLFLKRKYNLFQKTGEIKIARNCMMKYDDAEQYVHSINIGSKSKWFNFWKTNERPIGIPLDPRSVYKNRGWISWGKWLGKIK